MDKCSHPAARILLWCGWAVAVERAALPELSLLAVAIATAFLFTPVRFQLLRLLRRTRWLLAVLLLTYAFTVPGAALWPALGWASPSIDGVQQGALRAGRVGLLLGGLAILLAYTTRPQLIYGLYVLARPLSGLGFDRRAFAVRLGLTLDYVEHAPKPVRWQDALLAPLPDEMTPTLYTLQVVRWQSCDVAVILAGVLFAVLS
ncbi:MAG: CbiQ family ECF transporter T component [Thiobacillus sp.]|nr:CbiQ family ECF transporter T component [Thiobacillus sp.]